MHRAVCLVDVEKFVANGDFTEVVFGRKSNNMVKVKPNLVCPFLMNVENELLRSDIDGVRKLDMRVLSFVRVKLEGQHFKWLQLWGQIEFDRHIR